MWLYTIRTLALRVPSRPCNRSGVSRAIWCLLHPALAGALGFCWNGLISAFLMSEMGKSWAGWIAYKFFSYNNYSLLYLVTACFLSFTLGRGMSHEISWVFMRRGLGTKQGRTREQWLISRGLWRRPELSVASRWNAVVPRALMVCEAAGEAPSVEVSPQGVLGWIGSPCCPSSWTHQVFSTPGAGRRPGQLRRATSWHAPPTCSDGDLAWNQYWGLTWQHHSLARVGACSLPRQQADCLRPQKRRWKWEEGLAIIY